MLILLLGAGQGLQNGVEYDFRDDAINSIWISTYRTSMPYKGLKPGRWLRMDMEDYDAIVKDVPHIEHATPRNTLWRENTITYKDKSGKFDVRCTYPGHRYIENTEVASGRFLNDRDIEDKRKVVSVGEKIVEELYSEDENPIGTYLSINDIPFRVIGTFKDSGGEREMQKLYVPYSTANQTFNQRNRVHRMMLTTGDATLEESEKMVTQIEGILAERLQFDPKDKGATRVNNSAKEYQQIMNLFTGIRLLVWFVGIGTLAAGIIGVSNIMLIIVKERTKEIGLRKALGATPWSIVSLIVQESIFITSIAGYCGLVAGVGLLELVNMAVGPEGAGFFRQPEVDFNLAITATVLLVLAGALAGVLPAIRAANVNPIVALRDN